jgi:poly [ADP-ribose] polymerase
LFLTVPRWGRVGASGASKISHFNDLDAAKAFFATMFKKKTGYSWDQRALSKPTMGKYAMLEKDYESTSTKKSLASIKTNQSKSGESQQTQQSKLDPKLQTLISLIFDQDMMAESMKEFNYDESQLPLGKLTKNHIKKGYEVLKSIADVLTQPTNQSKSLKQLSNEFYTLIPHKFGMQTKPKVIDNAGLLKTRLEMVEQLMDIEIANALIEQVEKGLIPFFDCDD